jgi:hypothetical protein
MEWMIVRTSHFPESPSTWWISMAWSTWAKDKLLSSTERSRGPFKRDIMKLRILDGSTTTLESLIQLTFSLPNLTSLIWVFLISIPLVPQTYLPVVLSWFILHPWSGPLSCGVVAVRVKDSDGLGRFWDVMRKSMKSWTPGLFRTRGYQWPWPGSSRKLKYVICVRSHVGRE